MFRVIGLVIFRTARGFKKMDGDKCVVSGSSFHSRDSNVCVYCQSTDHKTTQCNVISSPEARNKYLADNKLCFNCASGQHAASSCKSKISCQKCKKRHHTSICLNPENISELAMTSTSALAEKGSPSLNDCLKTGPALQNELWDALIRGRFRPVILAADMNKALLQVRIREKDRDALRFHWLRNINSNEVVSLRFTRALLGLVSSPFLLGGVIEQHLANWAPRLPDRVR